MKTQISLCICAVRSESSLFTWRFFASFVIEIAFNEDSAQTARYLPCLWESYLNYNINLLVLQWQTRSCRISTNSTALSAQRDFKVSLKGSRSTESFGRSPETITRFEPSAKVSINSSKYSRNESISSPWSASFPPMWIISHFWYQVHQVCVLSCRLLHQVLFLRLCFHSDHSFLCFSK